jgi:plastocyanin
MTGKVRALAALGLALGLTVSACGGSGSSVSTADIVRVHVVVADQMFTPATVSVPVGGVVTWEFDDGGLPHDVIFSAFKSGALSSGSYSHAFDKVGVFTYHCSIHPWMTGTVDVTNRAPT